MSSGDGAASGSNSRPASPTKAIGSLAKKPSDVTRQGTQKLKFVPTIPSRRKKDAEVKQEPSTSNHAAPTPSDRGGRGRGRGRGRGDAPPSGPGRPPVVEMTASGPFAMGPSQAGQAGRRIPRSNFTPTLGPASSRPPGSTSSSTRPPGLKREPGSDNEKPQTTTKVNDEDEYSDPDEGVEIVDMDFVKTMDWAAPESLARERTDRKKKKAIKIKTDLPTKDSLGGEQIIDVEKAAEAGEVNLANALDLSESEEEEEMEDLVEDFAMRAEMEQDGEMRQERLYFFQFPYPFPTFLPTDTDGEADAPMPPQAPNPTKRVSFAPDSKPPHQAESSTTASSTPTPSVSGAQEDPKESAVPPPKLDGVIGQLEVRRSGAVTMRLANGIVLDVTAATQPSFLQHAAHVDLPNKRLSILGEVNKRFVVSPNVEELLAAMDKVGDLPVEDDHGLANMDTT